jgi:hypothetical protein
MEAARPLRRHGTEPTGQSFAWGFLFGPMEPRLAAFIDEARQYGAGAEELDRLEADMVALTDALRERVGRVQALAAAARRTRRGVIHVPPESGRQADQGDNA